MESDVKKNEPLPEGHIFQRKTFGDANPRGKARIYFCCHKDDFDLYFKKVTDELLEIRKDAAIWYRDPKMSCPNNQAFFDDLEETEEEVDL